MYEHDQEDILHALQEGFAVAPERQDHHGDEENDAEPLEGLLQLLRDLGKILRSKDTQCEGNAQEYEYGLENVPQRYDQLRHVCAYACVIEIKVAVQPEIERRHKDAQGCAYGRQADGQFHVRLAERGHEIRDVSAGTGRHQYHTESHGPADAVAQQQGQEESEQRQQDKLAAHSQDYGFGFAKHFHEHARLDAERDAEHDEGEHYVDGVHASGIEGDVQAVQ